MSMVVIAKFGIPFFSVLLSSSRNLIGGICTLNGKMHCAWYKLEYRIYYVDTHFRAPNYSIQYGLKSSGAAFQSFLAEHIYNLGFKLSRADLD